jgi:hypothetical protein
MSIHIYYLRDWQRKSQMLALSKLTQRPTAKYITEVLVRELTTRLGLHPQDLAQKVILGASDGAATLQGDCSGVLVRVRESVAPWALQIHCMAHRIDLCAGAMDGQPVAASVFSLLQAVYALCSRSPLRSQLLEQRQVSLGLPKLVMLRDEATQWISHFRPLERCLSNIAPLLLTCADIQDGKAGKCTAAADEPLGRLTNYSTLLAAAALQPLLQQLQLVIKALQVKDAYIVDLMDTVVATKAQIECLYHDLTGFSGVEFLPFLRLTTLAHEKCPLVESVTEQGSRVMAYRVVDSNANEVEVFTLYAVLPSAGRSGRSTRPCVFSKVDVPEIVQVVKSQVLKCVESVVAQMTERISEPKLLRSLGIVFPQTFDAFDDDMFSEMVSVFSEHFGAAKKTQEPAVDEEQIIEPIINKEQLLEQKEDFVNFAIERAKLVPAVVDCNVPRVVQFWRSFSQS